MISFHKKTASEDAVDKKELVYTTVKRLSAQFLLMQKMGMLRCAFGT